MRHVEELLPELVLGELAPADEKAVEEHLADCEACRRELALVREAFAGLSLSLPDETPSPAVRERLLASAAAGGRLAHFALRVAALLDVAADKAQALLDGIDAPASWEAGPIPLVELFHLPTGPRLAGVHAGFVRTTAGMHFPTHRHLGREQVLVIQGTCVDSNGSIYRPGDEMVMEKDSTHSFDALPGVDFVYLVVLEGGFKFVDGSSPTM